VVEPTDAEVIVASCTAPGAFGAIFDRHATVVHRYLIRRVGADEADALVGDVFRIAFERRQHFDPDRASARPWLYGIATNLVARRQRTEARRLRATARLAAVRAPTFDPADAVAAAVDAGTLWPRVAEALTALPAGERDALLLHAWEGLSYAEVADALDLPVGTVRSRLNRARRRLRELAGPSGEQLDDQPDAPHPDRAAHPVPARPDRRVSGRIGP
jgi:RNA polymerase sigma-70 factor (ECF subfamily)